MLMPKKYSKQFHAILAQFRELTKVSGSIHSTWIISDKSDYAIECLIYLEAKNLIEVTQYIDGGFKFKPTANGITYFEDRKEKLLCFWLPVSLSIIAIVVSIIALVMQ